MIFYKFFDDAVGVADAADDKIFEASILSVLANPNYRIQIFLIIFLPVFAYQLIPLLKYPDKLCELLIF